MTGRRRLLAASFVFGAELAGCDLILDLPHPARDAGAPTSDGSPNAPPVDGALGAAVGPDAAADAGGAGPDAAPDASGDGSTGPLGFCQTPIPGATILFCADFDGTDAGFVTRSGAVKEVLNDSAISPPNTLLATSDGGTGATYEPATIAVRQGPTATFSLYFKVSWTAAAPDQSLLFARVTTFDPASDAIEVWADPPASGDLVTLRLTFRPNPGTVTNQPAQQIPRTFYPTGWSTDWHLLALRFPFGQGKTELSIDGVNPVTITTGAMVNNSFPVPGLGVFQGAGSATFDSVAFYTGQ